MMILLGRRRVPLFSFLEGRFAGRTPGLFSSCKYFLGKTLGNREIFWKKLLISGAVVRKIPVFSIRL